MLGTTSMAEEGVLELEQGSEGEEASEYPLPGNDGAKLEILVGGEQLLGTW